MSFWSAYDVRRANPRWHATQGAGNKTGIFLALPGFWCLCAALYWGFLQEPETPPPATTQTPVTPEVEIEVEKIVAAPAQPEAEPAVPEAPEPEVPVEVEPPPISLGESDGVLAETMASINAGQLGEQFIMRPNGLERGVAIVDNLRQGAVPYKLLPVGRPSKAFPFSDNGLAVTMDPVGFERYNGLADTIAGIDVLHTLRSTTCYRSPLKRPGTPWVTPIRALKTRY